MVMEKRTVVRVGDIFCVEIDGNYKCYFQYVIRNDFYLGGQVIRVFKERYAIDTYPDMDNIVNGKVAFYVHTLIKVGLKYKAWYKVGKSANVGTNELKTVIFGDARDVNPAEPYEIRCAKAIKNWYIYKVNEKAVWVGELPTKYQDILQVGGIIPFVEIINRIKYGYYRFTRSEYAVLKREPWPETDSYLKVMNDKETIYFHFKGQRAKEEVIITRIGEKLRLSDKDPVSNGYRFRNEDFYATNWQYDNFITSKEFDSVWDS